MSIKQVEIRLPTQLQKEEESEHKNYIYDCMNILAMTWHDMDWKGLFQKMLIHVLSFLFF